MCFLKQKVQLLVSELYIHQNAKCNDKNKLFPFKKFHLQSEIPHWVAAASLQPVLT